MFRVLSHTPCLLPWQEPPDATRAGQSLAAHVLLSRVDFARQSLERPGQPIAGPHNAGGLRADSTLTAP